MKFSPIFWRRSPPDRRTLLHYGLHNDLSLDILNMILLGTSCCKKYVQLKAHIFLFHLKHVVFSQKLIKTIFCDQRRC